eukprot:1316442-Rhodomonas_salina.1
MRVGVGLGTRQAGVLHLPNRMRAASCTEISDKASMASSCEVSTFGSWLGCTCILGIDDCESSSPAKLVVGVRTTDP